MMTDRTKQLVIVRGGGDIATGTIHRLRRCGYPVLILETGFPLLPKMPRTFGWQMGAMPGP